VSATIGVDEVEQLAVRGIATVGLHPGMDVIAVGLHRLDAVGGCDDRVRVLGSQFASRRRRACLGDGRAVLR